MRCSSDTDLDIRSNNWYRPHVDVYHYCRRSRLDDDKDKDYFCSSALGMIQGSEVTNCCVGTPSSKSLVTAAEKLRAEVKTMTLTNKGRHDLLLEEKVLVIGVCLGKLLEGLVLNEHVIRSAARRD